MFVFIMIDVRENENEYGNNACMRNLLKRLMERKIRLVSNVYVADKD